MNPAAVATRSSIPTKKSTKREEGTSSHNIKDYSTPCEDPETLILRQLRLLYHLRLPLRVLPPRSQPVLPPTKCSGQSPALLQDHPLTPSAHLSSGIITFLRNAGYWLSEDTARTDTHQALQWSGSHFPQSLEPTLSQHRDPVRQGSHNEPQHQRQPSDKGDSEEEKDRAL
jgi:hypothetical protein